MRRGERIWDRAEVVRRTVAVLQFFLALPCQLRPVVDHFLCWNDKSWQDIAYTMPVANTVSNECQSQTKSMRDGTFGFYDEPKNRPQSR